MMKNPPRIWLDYRPVRIGWVVSERDVSLLTEMANWNACLWGGRFNCVIPAYDADLANSLVSCFAVDVLLPIRSDATTKAFIDGFSHLEHHLWHESIFHARDCEYVDIRHVLRRIAARSDKENGNKICVPSWDSSDPLAAFFALQFGGYPVPGEDVADYRGGLRGMLGAPEFPIAADREVPPILLDQISPLALTSYDVTQPGVRTGRRSAGIVLGSVSDFDTLVLFWNLRAAGAPLILYDEAYGARLKNYANAFLEKIRRPNLDKDQTVTFWIRSDIPQDISWQPDLDLAGLTPVISDGRHSVVWNGFNIQPHRPSFSLLHRDVVPTYFEGDGKADGCRRGVGRN